MTSSLTVRKAKKQDYDILADVLHKTQLPIDGVADHIENFLIAESKGNIAGMIGLEIYPPHALVRSAAVLPEYRNHGIGTILFHSLLKMASEQQLTELYLFTNTAESFFQRKGFSRVKRSSVEGNITSSVEFKIHACESAVLMRREIE